VDIDSSNNDELLKFFNSHSSYKTSEISMKYDISVATLRVWMRKCGYKPPETPDTMVLKKIGGFYRRKNAKKLDKKVWNNKEWFEHAYNVDRFGLPTISKITGLNINTVLKRLKRYGIATRNLKECNKSQNKYCNREWCFRKYVIEECSLGEMAKIAGTSPHTIQNWLSAFKIQVRDRNSSLQVALRKRHRTLRKLK
jgi:predicted HTH domain antitoxin